jgi:tRNA threonylcarbamoyladenosine biosynthesis protein TsaB
VAKILAIDTSTEACSAALLVGDSCIERFESLPRGHAQHILGMVEAVLAEAEVRAVDLDAVAFCRGPGAFTGVRIACGVVQGMAFAADLPVVPLSTLAVLAQGALRQHGAQRVLAAIDARMGEVYAGHYRVVDDLMVLEGLEVVAAPSALPRLDAAGWIGVGTGWAAYGDLLRQHLGEPRAAYDALPRARDCLPLAADALARGQTVSAEQAVPVYLRDKVTG